MDARLSVFSTPRLIDTPNTPWARLILAHGAGAAMDTPFMQTLTEALVAEGVECHRFEFPYMAERRTGGKKRPPNPAKQLIACWQQVIEETPTDLPLFIGGKSMGGRIATLLETNPALRGILAFGYPFHPIGKPDKLRLEALQAPIAPTLIIQGSRDTMGNRDEVATYPLHKGITLHWLEDGDHSFKPRVRSGFTHEEHLRSAAQIACQFMRPLAQ